MAEFHFAWVDPEETAFDPEVHARMDDDVLSFEIEHNEGEFAVLTVELKTPDTGLINPARKKYAWLSVTRNEAVTPLLFGRVTAFPRSIDGPTVQIELVAQFPGWQSARAALFDTLKVLPFWDPAFIPEDQRDDPEIALEARTARYHYHRTTGAVTLSDILTGGTTVTVNNALRDSLSTDITGHPARRVNLRATVEWEQRIVATSLQAEGAIRFAFGSKTPFSTFTGAALEADWPEAGDTLGGNTGYQVIRSRLIKQFTLTSGMPFASAVFRAPVPADERAFVRAATGLEKTTRDAQLERTWYNLELEILGDWRQKRRETISAPIENDVQALVFDDDQLEISLDIQAEDVVALGLMSRRGNSYFQTTRGRESFAYLLARAAATLANSARAVEVGFEVPFFDALMWSCDHQVTLNHRDLPGGTATGKMIGYRLACDARGVLSARGRLGVSVGNGESYMPGTFEGDYVDLNALGPDVQTVSGETAADPDLPEMIFTDYSAQDPPYPTAARRLASENIIDAVNVTNPPQEQEAFLIANQYPARDDVAAVLAEVPTSVELELVPLAAEDEIVHDIVVTMTAPWAAPKGIDLSA